MKPSLVLIAAAVGLASLPCRTSVANNNLFLPGDAFFPTELTEEDLKRIRGEASGKRTFVYSSFDTYEMAFCGDAGYGRVMLEAVDDDFAKNLTATYLDIRKQMPRKFILEENNGKTNPVEINPIRVLFYSSSFQFPKHSLGLRYNENWVEEAISFGHKRDHLRLCCLINHTDAIERSWRDARVVSPLGELVAAEKNSPGSKATAPVTIRGPLRAVVIGEHLPADFFGSQGEANWLYVVDSSGSKELRRYDGTWREPRPDDGPF